MRACRWLQWVILAIVVSPSTAEAFNEKGHLTIARCAWLRLTPAARQRASEILKSHPHYEEYLSADRPSNVTADEWAFMRASYWPDWVRSNHSDAYNQPTWHYITAAFVPARSHLPAPVITHDGPNVVKQIAICQEKLRAGTPAEQPISMCWLLHLVGDIHQPLHCGTLYNETFPEGDRGGNLSLVRINSGMPVRLHATWDDLLGTEMTMTAIEETVASLLRLDATQSGELAALLANHPAPADWAAEGFALAVDKAYLHGDLITVNADTQPAPELVPNLSEAYLTEAREVAQLVAVRAMHRLAICLEDSLRP